MGLLFGDVPKYLVLYMLYSVMLIVLLTNLICFIAYIPLIILCS